jgi:hypothetical protein
MMMVAMIFLIEMRCQKKPANTDGKEYYGG